MAKANLLKTSDYPFPNLSETGGVNVPFGDLKSLAFRRRKETCILVACGYCHGAHTKTDLKVHLVWIPKYRKPVFYGRDRYSCARPDTANRDGTRIRDH